MSRLSKNLHVAYGGKTYTIPLYDSHDGMPAYSYMIVDDKQAYIPLVAENSDLATTPLHIKEHTGSQFRVTDRIICKVTVSRTGSDRNEVINVVHRGDTISVGRNQTKTFYAIAGESIRAYTKNSSRESNGDIKINNQNTNTTDYTFTIWGDATIEAYDGHYEHCNTDSSGCGGEGG